VVYIQNRNIKFYHKMGGTGRWYIKWNKLDTERQVLTVLCNIRKTKKSQPESAVGEDVGVGKRLVEMDPYMLNVCMYISY
jgi:hypothetical protein